MSMYKAVGLAALLATVALPAVAQQAERGATLPSHRPGMSQTAPTGTTTAQPGMTYEAAPVSDATVTKVGAALRDVTHIRQGAAQQLQTANTDAERQSVAQQVTSAEESAVMRRGISVATYNQVIAAAHRDPALRQRVLAAANTAG